VGALQGRPSFDGLNVAIIMAGKAGDKKGGDKKGGDHGGKKGGDHGDKKGGK